MLCQGNTRLFTVTTIKNLSFQSQINANVLLWNVEKQCTYVHKINKNLEQIISAAVFWGIKFT